MAKIDTLCPDAKRLLVDGVPLRQIKDGTRYFLYPLSKEDYKIVADAINQLRDICATKPYEVAKMRMYEFARDWGFNPFKEGAFMGSTKIASDEDYEIIKTFFGSDTIKNPTTDEGNVSYQCFCHKRFKNLAYATHPTIKSSWDCMLIAYNNPPYAIVLSHKVDKDGNRLWEN